VGDALTERGKDIGKHPDPTSGVSRRGSFLTPLSQETLQDGEEMWRKSLDFLQDGYDSGKVSLEIMTIYRPIQRNILERETKEDLVGGKIGR